MRVVSLVPVVAAALLATGAASVGASPAGVTGENHVHSILISPNNPNVLYLGAHYHLYKSTDGGKKWRPLLSHMVLSMAMDPAHQSTIYAVSLQDGFIVSTDGGKHWTIPHSRPPKSSVTGVVYDARGKTILAYAAGIYRSTDGGKHWTSTEKDQSFTSVAVSSDGVDFAASTNGLFVSHDHGEHWKAAGSIGSQPVLQVAASGRVAYAIGPISLYKTSNDGSTWSTISKAPIGIEFLGVAPSDPNEVIGEVTNKGFYASRNGGASWQHANSGIRDRDFNASTVRVAPSSPKIAYTGAWGLDFYATHDGGRHWTLVSRLVK